VNDPRIAEWAARLAEARRLRRPVDPLAEAWPSCGRDEAYAVQRAGIAARVAAGARVVGHKVGLTSKAMQEMLGIGEPDFGVLLDDMAVDDGGAVDASAFIAPRAEIELAFRLDAPLRGPGVTPRDVLAATGLVYAAIEIIDSRIVDWRIGLVDTVADNASSGAFVLASAGQHPRGLDLPALSGVLRHSGAPVEYGDGAAVLGDPAAAVAWLANTLGARGGGLSAGDVVLSGACTRAVGVVAGDEVSGEFDGLGAVSVRFR